MKKIVIATKNQGKIREMMEAFEHLPVEVVSLADFGELPDAVEDGDSFSENARIKAKFYMEHTGFACLADDSSTSAIQSSSSIFWLFVASSAW